MTSEMTPADIRACTGGCDNGFGSEGWLPWFFLTAMGGGGFGGWGGNGMLAWLPWLLYGGGFGGWGGGSAAGYGQYATAASQQEILFGQQFNRLESKMDGINNGLCDGFYSTTVGMNNGFAGVQNTLAQGFAGINTELVREGYEDRIAINGVGQRVGDCCCDMRQQMAANDYNCATRYANMSRQLSETGADLGRAVERGFCDTQYRDQINTTAIMQNAHADTDRIIARIDKIESDRQAERIAQLTADNNALRFQASQVAQNAYLIDKLGYHCPQAAYVVQPPQQVTFRTDCCGGTSYAASPCAY